MKEAMRRKGGWKTRCNNRRLGEREKEEDSEDSGDGERGGREDGDGREEDKEGEANVHDS